MRLISLIDFPSTQVKNVDNVNGLLVDLKLKKEIKTGEILSVHFLLIHMLAES